MDRHLEDGPATSGAWLYVEEVTHRVVNEYTAAISALRLAATKALGDEARSAVSDATRRLTAFAAAHILLSPPRTAGQVNLAEHLGKLCATIALARFQDRRIALSIRTATPIMLDATRCWRTSLVVSELITNAARHGFRPDHQPGEIAVSVKVAGGQIVCGVHDTGTGSLTFTPGLGTGIVDSLAADLGGHVVRRSDGFGTLVELAFPQVPAGPQHALLRQHQDRLRPSAQALSGAPNPSLPAPDA